MIKIAKYSSLSEREIISFLERNSSINDLIQDVIEKFGAFVGSDDIRIDVSTFDSKEKEVILTAMFDEAAGVQHIVLKLIDFIGTEYWTEIVEKTNMRIIVDVGFN